MPDIEHSKLYTAARQLYWEQQTDFRRTAIREIRRILPAKVHAVILEIGDSIDTPRLTVSGWLDNHGRERETYELEGSGVYDAVDQIASDMEAPSWHEAQSFLRRADDGEHFIIHREEPR